MPDLYGDIMNFPSSPTLNQEYSFGTKSWRWNGTAWQIISVSTTEAVSAAEAAAAAAGSASSAATSATAASTSASSASTSASNAASSATAAAASAASINDATLVHKTGDETIAGTKTFSSPIAGSVTGNAATATTATNVSGGTANVTTLTTSSTVTLNGGTANSVPYLNGSKVLTSGSALTFDGSNLGLGVTPSAGQVAADKVLEMGAAGCGLNANTSRVVTLTANSWEKAGVGWVYGATAPSTMFQQQGGAHYWYTAPSGTAGNAISFTQAMTLDASGNLLVGTTSGSYKVNVSGDVNVTGSYRVNGVATTGLTGGQTGSAPLYGARAWVNFNGTGTVAIRASGNVSSITDNGVGDYTVNFATAMPDANYGFSASSSRNSLANTNAGNAGIMTTAPSTNAIRIGTANGASGTEDALYVSVSIFR